MAIFGYLLLFNALYQALYGFLLTPFQAWMPEITSEHERLEVSGYQNTVNLIAFIIGAGSAFLLPALIGGESETVILSEMNDILPFLTNGLLITLFVGIFSLMVIIFFIPSILTIKVKEVFIPQPNVLEELRVVFSNSNYIWWTISRGFLSIALSIIMGIVLSWIDKALHFGTVEYLIFGLTLLGVMFGGFIFWGNYGNKKGKTKSFIYAIFWTIIWIPLTLFVGQIELVTQIVPTLIQAIIFCVLIAMGLSGFYLLPYAIVADIVEEDERRTGESRAGMYYGFESIPLNIFQFFGYLSVGFLLENFPIYIDWQGNAFSSGFLLWGPVSAVFMIIAVIIFWKFVDADPLRNSES